MLRKSLLAVALVVGGMVHGGHAQDLEERYTARTGLAPHWESSLNIVYGETDPKSPDQSERLVSLDIYVPIGLPPGVLIPTVIMVHGGAWQSGDKSNPTMTDYKVPFFTGNGFVYVCINYELSPAIMHPVHVLDVAQAINWVLEHGAVYHIDPHQLNLLGHSAGAHLAALATVKQVYRTRAGITDPKPIKRSILLDGTYDLPYRWEGEENRGDKRYIATAFGNDLTILEEASPIYFIGPEDRLTAPATLIFFRGTRSRWHEEISLRAALRANNIPTGSVFVTNTSHADINSAVGVPGSPMNDIILRFLYGASPESLDGIIGPTVIPPELQEDTGTIGE